MKLILKNSLVFVLLLMNMPSYANKHITLHFNIIHNSNQNYQALIIGELAEKIYAELSLIYDYDISRVMRIRLVDAGRKVKSISERSNSFEILLSGDIEEIISDLRINIKHLLINDSNRRNTPIKRKDVESFHSEISEFVSPGKNYVLNFNESFTIAEINKKSSFAMNGLRFDPKPHSISWFEDENFLLMVLASDEFDYIAVVSLQDGRIVNKFNFRLRGIRYPIISNDKKTLVFTASAGCYSNLWMYSVEQNSLKPLTDDEFTIRSPYFLDDKVMYKSNINPRGDIFSLEFNEFAVEINRSP